MDHTTDKLKEALHRAFSAQDFREAGILRLIERVSPPRTQMIPALGCRTIGTEAVVFSIIEDWSNDIPEVWIAREDGWWRVVHSDVPELRGQLAEDAILYLVDRINGAVGG